MHIYLRLNLLDLTEREGCRWISLLLFPVWSCRINPLLLIFPALYLFIRDIEDGWPSLVSLRLQDSGFEPNSSNSIPASCLDIQNASAAYGFTPCLISASPTTRLGPALSKSLCHPISIFQSATDIAQMLLPSPFLFAPQCFCQFHPCIVTVLENAGLTLNVYDGFQYISVWISNIAWYQILPGTETYRSKFA